MKKIIVFAPGSPGSPLPGPPTSQTAPIRPAHGYLVARSQEAADPDTLLLCDPLTGLVAYPSFESFVLLALPALARTGLHLAIGDVDDLRSYMTTIRADDPTLFGHLAGNDCMQRVGEATRTWAAEILDSWPFAICATFGGDEVIVAAAGKSYEVFLDAVADLSARIQLAAPRPCSFAAATTAPASRLVGAAASVYRRLVSRVDERLFRHKAEARSEGRSLDGALVDVGTIKLGRTGLGRSGGTAIFEKRTNQDPL